MIPISFHSENLKCEYEILSGQSANYLAIEVMKYMDDDWKLAGGVSIFPNAGVETFNQSVYKKYYISDDK